VNNPVLPRPRILEFPYIHQFGKVKVPTNLQQTSRLFTSRLVMSNDKARPKAVVTIVHAAAGHDLSHRTDGAAQFNTTTPPRAQCGLVPPQLVVRTKVPGIERSQATDTSKAN
jgi:hypothetical protein